MEIREKLVEILQRTREEEERFIAGLSDEERAAVGTPEAWAIKDTIAHLAEWQLRVGQRLAAARQGESPPTFEGDIDDLNAAVFEQYRYQSWDEVVRALERAHQDMVAHILALSQEDLVDTERFLWQEGRPLWRTVAGNGCIHPVLHLVDLCLKRGERDHAVELQEEMTPLLMALDDSATWQSIATYNLACVYALAGEKGRAIDKVGDALRLNPDLTEWSKEDPDLASIHEEPGYQALYAS
jgi:hypothetical protein